MIEIAVLEAFIQCVPELRIICDSLYTHAFAGGNYKITPASPCNSKLTLYLKVVLMSPFQSWLSIYIFCKEPFICTCILGTYMKLTEGTFNLYQSKRLTTTVINDLAIWRCCQNWTGHTHNKATLKHCNWIPSCKHIPSIFFQGYRFIGFPMFCLLGSKWLGMKQIA